QSFHQENRSPAPTDTRAPRKRSSRRLRREPREGSRRPLEPKRSGMYTSVPGAVNRRWMGAESDVPPGSKANFSPGISVYAGGEEVTSMAVRNRGESVTWGVFILVLGVVLLIGNFRPEWHVWSNLWK